MENNMRVLFCFRKSFATTETMQKENFVSHTGIRPVVHMYLCDYAWK